MSTSPTLSESVGKQARPSPELPAAFNYAFIKNASLNTAQPPTLKKGVSLSLKLQVKKCQSTQGPPENWATKEKTSKRFVLV
jgi:hypothetical protein